MHKNNVEYYLEQSGVAVSDVFTCFKSFARSSILYQNAIEDQDDYVIDGIEGTVSYCLRTLLKTNVDPIHLKLFVDAYRKATPGQMIKISKYHWVMKPKMPKAAKFKNEINEEGTQDECQGTTKRHRGQRCCRDYGLESLGDTFRCLLQQNCPYQRD